MLRRTKLGTFGAVALAAGLGSVAAFVLVEGASSLILFASDALDYHAPGFHEGLPTRYDAELGWVNEPNASIRESDSKTLLKINSQGFRADHDFSRTAPPGMLRVLCSGDSMTFGYGVDDEHVWCQLLSSRDRGLETVNMSQAGYGLDQCYLGYVRDGAPLEHAVQILGLVTDEFYRMQQTRLAGHGKPVLRLRGEELIAENVPVPQSFIAPFLRRRFQLASKNLRVTQLVKAIRRSVKDGGGGGVDEETWRVAARVLASLAEMNHVRGSTLVVAYLPTEQDYLSAESDPWRERVRRAATDGGFVYIDLVPPFREMSLDRVKHLILQVGSDSPGHYSEAGNQWIADALYDRLTSIPSVEAKLRRPPR